MAEVCLSGHQQYRQSDDQLESLRHFRSIVFYWFWPNKYHISLSSVTGKLFGVYGPNALGPYGADIPVNRYGKEDARSLIEPWRAYAELGNDPAAFRITDADVSRANRGEMEVAYTEFIPGTDCETGRAIGGLINLVTGMPMSVTVSRGDFEREPLFTTPLTKEAVFGKVFTTVEPRFDWPAMMIITNNARYQLGSYETDRVTFSPRHEQLVARRTAFLVYNTLVGWPSEDVPGGWLALAEVFTDALTGEVLAVQKLPMGGFSGKGSTKKPKANGAFSDLAGKSTSEAKLIQAVKMGSWKSVLVRQGGAVYRARLAANQSVLEIEWQYYRIGAKLASALRYANQR